MRGISSLGITFATVHCGESKKMLEAAVRGAGGKVHLLGVTVLTSVAREDLRLAGYDAPFTEDVTRLVVKKADMARSAGFAGVICSGHEAGQIKKTCGESFLAVTPGIRPAWDIPSGDDQARVMTCCEVLERDSDGFSPFKQKAEFQISIANHTRVGCSTFSILLPEIVHDISLIFMFQIDNGKRDIIFLAEGTCGLDVFLFSRPIAAMSYILIYTIRAIINFHCNTVNIMALLL